LITEVGLFNWQRAQDRSVITGSLILTCIAVTVRTTRGIFSILKVSDREISSLVVLVMIHYLELCGNQLFTAVKATTSQTALKNHHISMVAPEMTVVATSKRARSV
jgi:hypothetical protein